MNVTIKKASSDAVYSLQQIGKQTFYETFSPMNSEENMKTYLENSFSAKKISLELNDPNSEIYFAHLDNDIIGYLKVNFGPSQTEIKDDKALEIERIYVLKAHQGKKIGQLFYQKALEIATQHKLRYIWLGVWEENKNAINFYEKNEFRIGNMYF